MPVLTARPRLLPAALLVAAVAPVLGSTAPAAAAPPSTLLAEAHCATAGTVVLEIYSHVFKVAGTTTQFVPTAATATLGGQTDVVLSQNRGTLQTRTLDTCTYTGPASGRQYTVTGFFTPAA